MLLMVDILMPETCWAHKKWNKIASDIKFVFYPSTETIAHIYCLHILNFVADKADGMTIFEL